MIAWYWYVLGLVGGIAGLIIFMKKVLKICPIQTTRDYIRALTSDDSGRPSLAKTILFWSFITSTIMCLKLIVMGGFSEGYFAIYLTIASGHTLGSKYLDGKKEETPQ